MTIGDRLNPWRALVQARAAAERWKGRAEAYATENRQLRIFNEAYEQASENYRGAVVELQRANDELRIERDLAWSKLGRRSAGIARGNRTRALRRRGALLSAPINHSPFQGAEA